MSKSVVKVGNHWGSVDAEWVRNKTEPPMKDQGPVAVSGTKDFSKVQEVAPDAPKPAVPAKRNGPDPVTPVS